MTAPAFALNAFATFCCQYLKLVRFPCFFFPFIWHNRPILLKLVPLAAIYCHLGIRWELFWIILKLQMPFCGYIKMSSRTCGISHLREWEGQKIISLKIYILSSSRLCLHPSLGPLALMYLPPIWPISFTTALFCFFPHSCDAILHAAAIAALLHQQQLTRWFSNGTSPSGMRFLQFSVPGGWVWITTK